MKKIILAALVLFSVIGCGSDDNDPVVPGNNTPVPIAFVNIHKGVTGTFAPEGNFVIQNQEAWNTFKTQIGLTSDALVDFSIHEIIAVVDKVNPNLGYDIEITSITKLDNKLTVKIKKTEPNPDEGIFLEQVQPYHVVRINKTGLPVVFKADAPM